MLSTQHREIKDQEWEQVQDILAAKVPDVERTEYESKLEETKIQIGNISQQVRYIQNVAGGLLQQWITQVRRKKGYVSRII